MSEQSAIEFKKLTLLDIDLFRQLNEVVFAQAFDDLRTYAQKRPSDQYVELILSKKHIICLTALLQGQVIAGLVAYLLEKTEQERSEIYIYDLAVLEPFRRKKIATKLINELKIIAKSLGAWVIFVQADKVDTPAIKLYQSLGTSEEPIHFDIPV